MRLCFNVLIVCVLLPCCTIGAGSLGAANRWEFDCTSRELKASLDELEKEGLCDDLNEDRNFYSSSGYDFLDFYIFCIEHKNSKLMVSMVKNDLNDDDETKPAVVSLRAVWDNDGWHPIKNVNVEDKVKYDILFKNDIVTHLSVFSKLVD